jgi:AraC-like DNA-binding protein
MPGSITSAFSEPQDFEDVLRKEGGLKLLITGPGKFRAQLTQITLHRVRLLAAEDHLSHIAFIAVPADTVITAFPIGDGTASSRDGTPMHSGEIMILSPGEYVHLRTDGPRGWGAIWFPVEELVGYGSAMTGAPFAIPVATQRWRPPREAAGRLRDLHAAAVRMASTRPLAFADAEAARGLEQQLIEALVECLSEGSAEVGSATARRHRAVMAQFERLLQTQPKREAQVKEICAALGVSERQLRSLCAEHLGLGPITYDRRRRMSLVHRALLRRADGVATSVYQLARSHGFRSPGRFAVNYRAAFGESPSTTLRRGRDRQIVLQSCRKERASTMCDALMRKRSVVAQTAAFQKVGRYRVSAEIAYRANSAR